MKRIRALEEPTPGLVEYREEEGDSATWEGFGSHRGSTDAKRELAEGLANVQHGLCGYCEINLHPRDREIEHVIPRSDTERGGAERALDHTNMIACCRGNASEPHHPDLRGDPARFLRPVNAHRSCGQAKGDQSSDEFGTRGHCPRYRRWCASRSLGKSRRTMTPVLLWEWTLKTWSGPSKSSA